VRIHDHWRTLHPNATTLPAVLPFVLYHGDKPWAAPRSPKDLVDLTGSPAGAAAFLRPLQLHQPFVLLDLSGHTEAEIDAMRLSAIGSLSLRFLQFLRHAPPEHAAALILRWQHLVTELLAHPRGREVLYALFSWYAGNTQANAETLRTVMTKIHQENPPMRSLLDQILEVGEERGLQKGALHGQRRLLEQQLVTRFGELAPRFRDQLDIADASLLQTWGLRVLAATRIEDVFQTP
jgi:hypothetical protein